MKLTHPSTTAWPRDEWAASLAFPRTPQDGQPAESMRGALHPRSGFTLLELLVVIAIIGILAGISVPVLNHFKPNYHASVTRQLLDELARTRQLAISEHTTVLMVFVPTNFWTDPAVSTWRPLPTSPDWVAASNLFEKQMIGYAFVSLRTMGDQPGRPTPQYLSGWRTLPEGAFIAWQKFAWPYAGQGSTPPFLPPMLTIQTNDTSNTPRNAYPLYGFDRTNSIPFPLVDTPPYLFRQKSTWVTLPYIAFDYLGRRCTADGNPVRETAFLPLTKGSVGFSHDSVTKRPVKAPPEIKEVPPGNGIDTNSYNVVCVDWLTGRAHVEHQEVR